MEQFLNHTHLAGKGPALAGLPKSSASSLRTLTELPYLTAKNDLPRGASPARSRSSRAQQWLGVNFCTYLGLIVAD